MEYTKRYDEEGNVAVLISPGFGAGWSTWSRGQETEALLFDSRLVDAVLAEMPADEFEKYCESLGYEHYMGGAKDLEVIWLEPGTRFQIHEYDGSETIQTFDDLCHVA